MHSSTYNISLDTESLDTTDTTFELAKRQEKIPPKEVKVKLLNGEESSIFVLPTTEQDTVKMIRGEYPQTDPFALRDVIDQYNEFDVIIMDLPPQVTPSMCGDYLRRNMSSYLSLPVSSRNTVRMYMRRRFYLVLLGLRR